MLSQETMLKIDNIISNLFLRMSIEFLGKIPELSKNKHIIFNAGENNLAKMFFLTLGKKPNELEEDIFKQMITAAYGYVKILEEKTKTRINTKITQKYTESKISGEKVDVKEIRDAIKEEIEGAKSHFEVIVGSETKNTKNMATVLKIMRMSSERGIKRPIVYFHPIIDERNDPETYRLHLLPDKKTPRLWYLDELNTGYHKKGDDRTSVFGTNPSCRCILLPYRPGYHFDENGHIDYKKEGWNELEEQRKKYGMP